MPPPRQFGIPPSKRTGGSTHHTTAPHTKTTKTTTTTTYTPDTTLADALALAQQKQEIEEKMGYSEITHATRGKKGWLVNMDETRVLKEQVYNAIVFYFLSEAGETFKATVMNECYFIIAAEIGYETEVEEFLRRKFENSIVRSERIIKQDLDMPNHLLDAARMFIKLIFKNSEDMTAVKRAVQTAVKRNQLRRKGESCYFEPILEHNIAMSDDENTASKRNDPLDAIVDIREYDVPYIARVCMDQGYRVGLWYDVEEAEGVVNVVRNHSMIRRGEPVVLAFDIETTKLPLKFPDATTDQIMMISYMIDGQGYLITNREIVSEDIEDFDYNPSDEYQGPFIIFNESNEKALIMRFFEHIVETKPAIFVTYNGDYFDWPFVETRAKQYDIDMFQEIGFYKNDQDEYESSFASHMDCFKWVKRDSYLPAGSHGLKAVTRYKLGYDPLELDPEDMLRFASEHPSTLASYSVSDAVATYYLYMKYVHPFTFSLCTVIPLKPDDVLRKGSGTLCEMLLMAEAYEGNIIMPNKHVDEPNKKYGIHALHSETYVGGHVEALESGVFRSDIATKFVLDPGAFQELIDEVDAALQFAITKEGKIPLDDIVDYDEVKSQVVDALINLRDTPTRLEKPLIYHLDVAAMYPNIILTNRLQSPALVNEATCAACDFYRPGADCQRELQWQWRGEYWPTDRGEYNMIQAQLEAETFPPKAPGEPKRRFTDLSLGDQQTQLNKRLGEYSRKVYKKTFETKVELRTSVVCMRENPFYVETVKKFRDRRYEYKTALKKWKKTLDQASDLTSQTEAKSMIVLYDSLQTAHKCILNSFYGYMMRKGSRWYSMEMAGIVCWTGANIIRMARELVERVGRPLELDTDGIWCILPATFPETFEFTRKSGGKYSLSYPGIMLNHRVHAEFTNHQYQDLIDDEKRIYSVRSENSIFFEVDGPYLAMILPASKEEDKLLKKRYAVFNDDKTLAELKGFEVKRRGELKLIKTFQSQIFSVFLEGSNLEECYAAVAKVANHYLDILENKGTSLEDDELVDLISENRSMSKSLEDYGGQKSTSISTAKRLAEFLGDQMVKDKGLNCKFIVSAKPIGAPVTERAVPIAIFSAETSMRNSYLRKWLNDSNLQSFELRHIIDWAYYWERFSSVIQKLITIPAALQKVKNPVPRVHHPDWLRTRLNKQGEKYKQHNIANMFANGVAKAQRIKDFEDEAGINRDSTPAPEIPAVTEALEEMVIQEPAMESITPHIDYVKWLEMQRPKWRAKRKEAIMNNRAALMSKSANRSGAAAASSQLFKSSKADTWETIQIVQTSPDLYTIWGLMNDVMQPIKLEIPRVLYVNSYQAVTEQDVTMQYKQVQKILPRSHVKHHLYEYTMRESTFLANPRHIKVLKEHPRVAGIYGLHTSPLERILLSIGCVNTLKRSLHGKPLHMNAQLDTFELDHLAKLDCKSYLEHSRIHYNYIFHAHSGDRHMLGVWFTATSKAKIIVQQIAGLDQLPNLTTLYQDMYSQIQELQPEEIATKTRYFPYEEMYEFDISIVRDEASLYRRLNKIIADYAGERRGPTSLIFQASNPEVLINAAPRLAEFPYLQVPYHQNDDTFPALDWQRALTSKMFHNFSVVGDVLSEMIQMCRYADLPIGNLGTDSPVHMIDLIYSKALVEQNFLLWQSSSNKPDLGGKEEDECKSILDDIELPSVNIPGGYSTVSIEIAIEHLTVNTIVCSQYLTEVEGSLATFGVDAVQFSMDDHIAGTAAVIAQSDNDAFCPGAFRCLKQVVQKLLRESVGGNMVSVTLLTHLNRWLKSPKAKLYDPALCVLIHNMNVKIWRALLQELKKLGSRVIFADFNKILMLTTKTTTENARAYNDYLLRTLKGHRLFQLLNLREIELWEHLLWMDTWNRCGIRASLDAPEEEDAPPSLSYEWNIQTYLPPAIQKSFQAVIGQFVMLIYNYKKRIRTEQTTQERISMKVSNKEQETIFVRNLLQHELAKNLIEKIPQMRSRLDAMRRSTDKTRRLDAQFPILPGSHLPFDDPALEFIKMICHVLSLTPDAGEEAIRLRRQLLNQCQVKEFSKEAQFRNPCQTLVLQDVICSYCNNSTDFDLCRDLRLLKKPRDPNDPLEGEVLEEWTCVVCGNEYARGAVEANLIDLLRRRLVTYQLQDLSCPKCKRTKGEHMSGTCIKCSVEYEPTLKVHQVLKYLSTFEQLATYYEMEGLGEYAAWVRQGIIVAPT